jgi:hypothetical protein
MAVEQKDKPKTISIKEFKMWLQGVEEMQAEGWVPDARQWERIRAKIDQIEDAVVPAYTGYRAAPVEASELPPGTNLVFQPLNTAPPGPGGGAAIPLPSALNTAGPTPRAPRVATTPAGLPVTMASGTPTPVKTPDVDTSNGKPYNSQFT